MASSTTNLDLISSSQASKEVTANSLFDAESPAALYGRRASTTANLTWGYYGGYLSIGGTPTAIVNGTVVLTNAATNYITAARASGNVAVSTSNTSWNDTANHARLYSVVTAGNLVTSYTDVRSFALGAADPLIGVDAGDAQRVDQAPQAWTRNSTTALGNASVNGSLTNTGNNITTFTGTANVTYHAMATGNGILVHSATMNILQGAANITTSDGDTFDIEMITANTCRLKNYVSSQHDKVIESVVASANAATSGQYGDATYIDITAGTWDVGILIMCRANGATVTAFGFGIGTASGNSGAGIVTGDNYTEASPPNAQHDDGGSILPKRYIVTSTTRLYLKTIAFYSVATPLFFGRITAVRVSL